MIKFAFYAALFLLMVSCTKEEEKEPRQNFILAGESNGNVYYKDFKPDVELFGKKIVVGQDQLRLDTLGIDFNNDGVNELNFRSYDTLSCAVLPNNFPNNSVQISAFEIDQSFSSSSPPFYVYAGIISLFAYNDTINTSGEWSPLVNFEPVPHITNGYYVMAKSIFYPIETWHNALNKYMGLRYVSGQDTLYGCVQISVIGYSHLIIHDYAIQK